MATSPHAAVVNHGTERCTARRQLDPDSVKQVTQVAEPRSNGSGRLEWSAVGAEAEGASDQRGLGCAQMLSPSYRPPCVWAYRRGASIRRLGSDAATALGPDGPSISPPAGRRDRVGGPLHVREHLRSTVRTKDTTPTHLGHIGREPMPPAQRATPEGEPPRHECWMRPRVAWPHHRTGRGPPLPWRTRRRAGTGVAPSAPRHHNTYRVRPAQDPSREGHAPLGRSVPVARRFHRHRRSATCPDGARQGGVLGPHARTPAGLGNRPVPWRERSACSTSPTG